MTVCYLLECDWRQVNELRKQADDPATFDEMYELFIFITDKLCSYGQFLALFHI